MDLLISLYLVVCMAVAYLSMPYCIDGVDSTLVTDSKWKRKGAIVTAVVVMFVFNAILPIFMPFVVWSRLHDKK